MSEDKAIVDAEVVEPTTGELVPHEVGSTLFRTDEPAEVLTKATAIADALTPVIRAKNMVANIKGKEHLQVEAWQTLGAMLGVVPVCTKTTKLDNGWEAEVEARTLDGRVVGRAESMCTRDEGDPNNPKSQRWKDADEYAIRSMAQTRATSRALSSPLRFVVTLAGFSGTPAEEMQGVRNGGGDNKPSEKQEKFLRSLFAKYKVPAEEQIALVKHFCGDDLTKSGTSKMIEGLKNGRLEAMREAAGLGSSDVPADEDGLPGAQVIEEDGQIKADGVPF